jgi:hypothetical protein
MSALAVRRIDGPRPRLAGIGVAAGNRAGIQRILRVRSIEGDSVRTIRIWVAVMTVTAVTACVSHPAKTTAAPAPSAHSAAASPSPSPMASMEVEQAQVEAAIAAYRGLWNAYVANLSHPNPNDPALRQYASGDALKVFVSGLTSVKNQGLAGKGTLVLNPKQNDIELQDSSPLVGIGDCMDTAATHLYKIDGSSYHDTPGGHRRVAAQVRLIAGVWKVTEIAVYGVGSC